MFTDLCQRFTSSRLHQVHIGTPITGVALPMDFLGFVLVVLIRLSKGRSWGHVTI